MRFNVNSPIPAGLSLFDWWMVESNVERIQAGWLTVEASVAILRANGYFRVAAAVADVMEKLRG
jgi:hypothetical protein